MRCWQVEKEVVVEEEEERRGEISWSCEVMLLCADDSPHSTERKHCDSMEV